MKYEKNCEKIFGVGLIFICHDPSPTLFDSPFSGERPRTIWSSCFSMTYLCIFLFARTAESYFLYYCCSLEFTRKSSFLNIFFSYTIRTIKNSAKYKNLHALHCKTFKINIMKFISVRLSDVGLIVLKLLLTFVKL